MHTLVGKQAPDFTSPAVLANGEIQQDFHLSHALKGKYGLLFFYPLDFTFVCPSELIALNNRIQTFKAKDVEVIAISVDSHFTHNAWRKTPVEQGGIGPVQYTLVADITHRICQMYGVEHPEGVAFRGAFIIDKMGTIRAQHTHDLPIGRNIDELIRIIEALEFHAQNGEVCPAGWQTGKQGMQATPEGVARFLTENAETL